MSLFVYRKIVVKIIDNEMEKCGCGVLKLRK
jgi:hypothetical protein